MRAKFFKIQQSRGCFVRFCPGSYISGSVIVFGL